MHRPNTKRRGKCSVLRGLFWLASVVVLLLVLLPLWFPWMLTPIAARYGLRFSAYDRIGWTRFALNDVQAAWDGGRLEAQRIEAGLPATWLWQRLTQRTNGPPLLSLSGGDLLLEGPSTNALTAEEAPPQGSVGETLDRASRTGLILQRMLPVAELTDSTLRIGSTHLSVPHAAWRAGGLHAVVRSSSLRGELQLAARIEGARGLSVSADWELHDASVSGEFTRTDGDWRWRGELAWLTNRADLTARFTTNGWWPERAAVGCRDWQIPAGFLQVPGYTNMVASLTATVVSNRFDLEATGLAEPSGAPALDGWPAVSLALGASGDSSGLRIHTLRVQSPWLTADLTNTAGIRWTGDLLTEPAQLRIAVDLGKLPAPTLTGRVEGVVRIEPGSGRPPTAHFELSATQVGSDQWNVPEVILRGEFEAPTLRVHEFRADFADGSVLVAEGAWDGTSRRLEASRWKLSGGLLQQLLPDLRHTELVASGEFSGPLDAVLHRGEASLSALQPAGMKPSDVRASWSGLGRRLTAATVEWAAGDSVLSIAAAADFDPAERRVEVTLNRLSLRRGSEGLYALQEPCALEFRTARPGAPGDLWSLAVAAFDWRGDRRAASGNATIAWPSHGKASLRLTNIALADFSDFVESDLRNVSVGELAATAHWSNGPVYSVLSAAGSLTNTTGRVFGLRGNVTTQDHLSLGLKAIEVGDTPTLSVSGTIPLSILPSRREGRVVWDKSQTLALAGDWKDDQSQETTIPLGSWGQLTVTRPEVRFRVSGTPDEPSAELTAVAAQIIRQSSTNGAPWPRMEALRLAVGVRSEAVKLKTFSVKVDGQPILATGEWPLPPEAWRELWSTRKPPDWSRARGHLEMKGAEVSAFSAYLPEILSPEGHFSATVDLEAGKRFGGVLSLTNVATRPIGPITPMRDISALVRFDGSRAVLQDFRAELGGQPIRADGLASASEEGGSGLAYHLNLHGTNVPLARSPELLLRGDFDLALRAVSNQPPVLSGTVALRDGLYVQHASALLSSPSRRAEWRSPYFSVTNEPFANWKLDLAVRGDRFLRVRSPVFNGIASADFQLKGDLLMPVLTGDARVNSGHLIFPFGSLTLDEGLASFSGNDPGGPNLQLAASGRNYRYDLRLEVKGRADAPNVILSSTPPLAPEQILLMLTAGDMPQSEYEFSSGARAGRLATFVGKDLLSRYFGSDPARQRLVIQTGESISEAGRLTYSVEYRLTDRWSIIGEYDEFNAFNTDLKWKILTR